MEKVSISDTGTKYFAIHILINNISCRYQTYSDGEDLFGLNATQFPGLQRIRKELNLLQKLYTLYNAVMDSVDGYYEVPWAEVDIDRINSDIMEFQNRYE